MIYFTVFYFSTGLLLALSSSLHGTFARGKRALAFASLVSLWPLIVLVAPEVFFKDQSSQRVERDPLKLALSLLTSSKALPLTDYEKLRLQRVAEAGEAGVTYFGDNANQILKEFWDSGTPPAAHYALRSAKAALQDPEPEPAYYRRACFSLSMPDWYVGLSNEFLKCVSRIDRKVQGRILKAIAKIGEAPTTPIGNTIKPLTGDLSGLWRVRIGDNRLVYYPHAETQRVTLISFGPRDSVYSDLPSTENLKKQ
jgi:mRNA interferase RelE/StbE